jgi:predicted nucleic acid-binding protein
VGFLIDSDVLIAAEREQLSLPELTAELAEEQLALAAITASELLHGVHRAQDASIRDRRSRFVEFVLMEIIQRLQRNRENSAPSANSLRLCVEPFRYPFRCPAKTWSVLAASRILSIGIT